ncbi:prolyl oligopeptidase family serine peptidase [Peribacillus sp. CSMR9]|uniref:prolyl oligopeptidase family serine peptidase n=1 Tax=Peribacillus sp. CSMR9 TaxID=2981350 RepID=UPI0029536582|nr:prolyl oligopeptidase family serine peptidase [Peribacillus sp. CSMR9]MDV7765440.1 alpha/beta fold hydrolase [Peribacillus sp. CSMR9]
MIIIENEQIGHIPVLHLSEQTTFHQELPLIIFIHGYQSAKEHNLHYAYLLAEKGFRVLLPDVIHHGKRGAGLSDSQMMPRFWEMVLQTIQDISLMKDDLLSRKLIDPDRIGVAGTSMGGIVTNGAMAAYEWISAGVSLMGNPSYVAYAELQMEEIKKRKVNFPATDEEVAKVIEQLKPYDLSLNQNKLSNRPLLFWHGAKDPVVPYQHAYHFYEGVKAGYNDTNERIDFILDPKAGHRVSREGVLMTADWFAKYLLPTVQKA